MRFIVFRFGYSKMDLLVTEQYARDYSVNRLPSIRRTVVIAPTFISIATERRDQTEYAYIWREYIHPVKIEYDFTGQCGCTVCEAAANFYASQTGD